MSLNPELAAFINQPYLKNPPQIDKMEAGDCRWWLHQFYKTRFGIKLPTGLWSAEIWQDEELFFQTVSAPPFFEGDVFLFGPNHGSQLDSRQLHIAYFIGEKDETGNLLLLHATQYENKVVIWPLPIFSTKSRYQQLERIKRLKPELWEPLVKPVI